MTAFLAIGSGIVVACVVYLGLTWLVGRYLNRLAP